MLSYFNSPSTARHITYDEVADDHCQQKEGNAVKAAAVHAVPRRLDPLATQHAEDDHERVQEVTEVPARYIAAKVQLVVVASEHLPRHDDDQAINKSIATEVVWYYSVT